MDTKTFGGAECTIKMLLRIRGKKKKVNVRLNTKKNVFDRRKYTCECLSEILFELWLLETQIAVLFEMANVVHKF